MEAGDELVVEGRDRSRQVRRVDSTLLCGVGGDRPVASEKWTILEVGVPLKRQIVRMPVGGRDWLRLQVYLDLGHGSTEREDQSLKCELKSGP